MYWKHRNTNFSNYLFNHSYIESNNKKQIHTTEVYVEVLALEETFIGTKELKKEQISWIGWHILGILLEKAQSTGLIMNIDKNKIPRISPNNTRSLLFYNTVNEKVIEYTYLQKNMEFYTDYIGVRPGKYIKYPKILKIF